MMKVQGNQEWKVISRFAEDQQKVAVYGLDVEGGGVFILSTANGPNGADVGQSFLPGIKLAPKGRVVQGIPEGGFRLVRIKPKEEKKE